MPRNGPPPPAARPPEDLTPQPHPELQRQLRAMAHERRAIQAALARMQHAVELPADTTDAGRPFHYVYHARLQRIVDGDTFDADVALGFHASMRLRFRLLGVDTPERGEPGYREAGAALQQLIAEHIDTEGRFLIETHKTGKYGRWLAELLDQAGRPLNHHMATWCEDFADGLEAAE